MMGAQAFVDHLRSLGYKHFCGVPCSYLKPLSNCLLSSPDLAYVGAADEGQAVAIAAGLQLAGCPSVAMFQNSGLGNAVNPLTSLTSTFKIPLLLLCSLRGDPARPPDEPQHRLMGSITQRLLNLMEIPCETLPPDSEGLAGLGERANAHMNEHGTPYAVIIGGKDFEDFPLHEKLLPPTKTGRAEVPLGPIEPMYRRTHFLKAIVDSTRPSDALIATTGYASRELWAMSDRLSHLYMVGSMGCAAGLGLGVALAQPDRRVVVIDGDGALLMRFGLLATIGYQQPPRLCHIVLDNQQHESTGGQSTVSASLDLCAIASACGYADVRRVRNPDHLHSLLSFETAGPRFLHVPIEAGVAIGLPRPTANPSEIAHRFRAFLRETR